MSTHDVDLSVYVAGAWIHKEKIRNIMKQVSDAGFFVTSNWIDREGSIATPVQYKINGDYDIKEVTEADIVLAIMDDPTYEYRGTFTEIGCALGQRKQVIIVCPGVPTYISEIEHNFPYRCMTNIFYWCTGITHVESLEKAFTIMHQL